MDKIKETIEGVIETDWDDWTKIYLVQENSAKIDLIKYFQDLDEKYNYGEVQVNYYLSDKRCTKNELLEQFIKKISGAVDAKYTSESYHYSSWTNGTSYYSTLKIGGHDLFNELEDKEGKFIILELYFSKRN